MFEQFEATPPDPIIKLIDLYREDPRSGKIDVGVGVFRDTKGETPVMKAVRIAEEKLHHQQTTKTYVGLAGNETFNDHIADLVFARSPERERVRAIQTPGGCGALRLLSEMLYRIADDKTIWLSDPTWGNHIPIFRQTGFGIQFYPYLNRQSKTVDVDALLSKLGTLGKNDIVVFHGCCHNPSGAELQPEDWDEIAALCAKNGFLPYVDLAYQGFADSLEQDVYGVRALASAADSMVVASSCSKNFGLYRDRVGCAMVLGKTNEISDITRGHVLSTARSSYSMPPDHGGALVALILSDPDLRKTWEDELTGMRERMLFLRKTLRDTLRSRTHSDRWDFIASHRGMFSLLVLEEAEVESLRIDHAVYAVAGGRINIAGLQDEVQVEQFADALVSVTA